MIEEEIQHNFKIQSRLQKIIAVMSLIIMAFFFYNLSEVLKPKTNINEVFHAEVFVPNFKRGENPLVVYENEKLQNFSSVYQVEVKDTKGTPVCIGSNIERGSTEYTKDDVLDPSITDLSWFVDTLINPINQRGRKCHEVLAERPAQEYYITWSFREITLDNGEVLPVYRPEKSNTFRTY